MLRTELSFTHSLHAKTTKNLSGRTNPQHVLLAWNQNPSTKRGFTPLNSPPSALGTEDLHWEVAGTAAWGSFPRRNGEEDAGLHSSPLPRSGGPGRTTQDMEHSEMRAALAEAEPWWCSPGHIWAQQVPGDYGDALKISYPLLLPERSLGKVQGHPAWSSCSSKDQALADTVIFLVLSVWSSKKTHIFLSKTLINAVRAITISAFVVLSADLKAFHKPGSPNWREAIPQGRGGKMFPSQCLRGCPGTTPTFPSAHTGFVSHTFGVCPCPGQRPETRWFFKPIPTQTTPWFYDLTQNLGALSASLCTLRMPMKSRVTFQSLHIFQCTAPSRTICKITKLYSFCAEELSDVTDQHSWFKWGSLQHHLNPDLGWLCQAMFFPYFSSIFSLCKKQITTMSSPLRMLRELNWQILLRKLML